MLDIDDFKVINDTYGHQEGDNVLQQIAESGRAALRRGDLFGRIGGEEFAAVFPGCTPAHGPASGRAPAAGDSAVELLP